jgi:hypothetical protein
VAAVSERPILLGMNNPLSTDTEHALYPLPEGCTGHRIFCMINEILPASGEISMRQYLEMFDRRNLLSVREWRARDARAAAIGFLAGLRRRAVIVLGQPTWSALGLSPTTGLLRSDAYFESEFWRVPHPSGLNRWFNETRNRRAAARLMLRLARGEKTP